jgi:type IV secretion system protein VirD4
MDWRPFKKPESIHGDAKWATLKDVKKMGLRAKTGVLLGMYNKKMIIADGYQHILLFSRHQFLLCQFLYIY